MVWKGFPYKVKTIEVDLTQSIEDIWKNLDKDARWGVNKAKKEGLTVKEADESDAKEFYEIYRHMCQYNRIRQSEFEDIYNPGLDTRPKKILVCKKDEKLIAGASIIEDSSLSTISLYKNASLAEYLELQPNNLLYWSIIEYGKNRGIRAFDLGGYDECAMKGTKTYEINRFKARWGGKIVDYVVYSKNPLYILVKAISELSFIRNIKEKTPAKKDGI